MYWSAIRFFIASLILVACNTKTSSVNKKLIVREIEFDGHINPENVSQLLDEHAETHLVEVLNWEDYAYKPKVGFKIAHSNNQIWLKYEVEEANILAEKTESNSYVFKDSCVEFFFDPIADGNYYNFEINCIGTTLLAHGPERKSRKFISPELIEETLNTKSSLGAQPFTEKTGGHTWEITIILPAEILTHNPGIELKGLKARGNFYKCGDATSQRHYLSWNPIDTEKPDFHRPEYFGELIFE